jgi:hypothetical protein
LDWNAIGKLRPKDIGVLVASNKFSKDDEERLRTLSVLGGRMERKKKREDRQRNAEEKTKSQLEDDKRRMQESADAVRSQRAKTVTTDGGYAVSSTDLPPKPMSPEDAKKAEEVKNAMNLTQDESMRRMLDVFEKFNVNTERLVASSEATAKNTGNLGTIKSDLKENLKDAKDPKVVVVNSDKAASKRPTIIRGAINVAQQG